MFTIFFDIHKVKFMRFVPLFLNLSGLCDQQNMAETLLCQFSGPSLKRLVSSSSCLFKYILLEISHHVGRKFKQHRGEANREMNQGH